MNNIKARSLQNPPAEIVEEATSFVEELREMKQRDQESPKDFFTTLWIQRLYKKTHTEKIAESLVPFFYFKSKVLAVNPFDKSIDFLRDFNQAKPTTFHTGYQLTAPIMIRSSTSGDLMTSGNI